MSEPISEHPHEDSPMLSETSEDGSEGFSYLKDNDPAFHEACRVKLEAMGQKMDALRAAGHAALDALKLKWEQQCDKLEARMNKRLAGCYEDLESKAQDVHEGKERLEEVKRTVAGLNMRFMAEEEGAE